MFSHAFFVKDGLKVPEKQTYAHVIPQMMANARQIANKRVDLVTNEPSYHHLGMDDATTVSLTYGDERLAYQLTPFSTQQLCQKIGLPPGYFNRLATSADPQLRALAIINANAMLQDCDKSLLLRTVGKSLRGVLSPKYSIFDSDRILDVFASCVGYRRLLHPDNMVIRGYMSNMEVFHLRFTTAEPVKTKTDEDLYYGLDITSSDVGKYALSVRFFIYKRVCTNGMCLPSFDKALYKQSHIGINSDIFYQGLKHSLDAFPNLVAKATDIINTAGSQSLEDSPLFDLDSSRPEDVRYLEKMQRYLGVTQENINVIAELARRNYGTSLWAYGNAITEWAQRYNFDRRKELETKAGHLMTNFNEVMAS